MKPLEMIQAKNWLKPSFHFQAFWSLLWNKAASERLRLFGTSPVPGDLVLCRDERGIDGRRMQSVRVLTEQDLAGKRGRPGMCEVVLPVPGQGGDV